MGQAGDAAREVNLGIIGCKVFQDGARYVWAVRLHGGLTAAVIPDGTLVGLSMIPGDELISHAFMYQHAMEQGRGSW